MGMTKQAFGKTKDGKQATLYTLENANGMKVSVSDFGAVLVKLEVPDQNGRLADVTLGFDDVSGYEKNPSFFGAVIGPVANRIGKATFSVDGKEYKVAVNDGVNNLHSDAEIGTHKRFWNVEEGDNSVTMTLELPDGDMGFPGNKKCVVTYTLTDANEVKLHYQVSSDANCPINFTNHAYFNLLGHDGGVTTGHKLQILADSFTLADNGSIPTGEIVPVAGTPMDFTDMQVIGDRIDADFEQLQFAGGYDHNWVLNNQDQGLRLIAVAKAPDDSRTMKVFTDLPGVQFYAGNFIAEQTGKNGAVYAKRHGFCLETQYYPDSVNKPQFPSCVFGPERVYDTTTVYQF